MKPAKYFLIAFLMGGMLFGCTEQNNVKPKGDTNTVAASGGHLQVRRPTFFCGTPVVDNLILEEEAATYGKVELMNDRDHFYLIVTLNQRWALEDLYFFAGEMNAVPKDKNNMMDVTRFPHHKTANLPSTYTYRIPCTNLPDKCNDIVVAADIAQFNFFGGTFNNQRVYMKGKQLMNGYANQFCVGRCPQANNSGGTGVRRLP